MLLLTRLVNEAKLILGALNMSNSNSIVPSEPQRVVMYSRLILPHPSFSFEELEGTSFPADMALIRLPNPIEFNGMMYILVNSYF